MQTGVPDSPAKSDLAKVVHKPVKIIASFVATLSRNDLRLREYFCLWRMLLKKGS
jgi:hypothetical protein